MATFLFFTRVQCFKHTCGALCAVTVTVTVIFCKCYTNTACDLNPRNARHKRLRELSTWTNAFTVYGITARERSVKKRDLLKQNEKVYYLDLSCAPEAMPRKWYFLGTIANRIMKLFILPVGDWQSESDEWFNYITGTRYSHSMSKLLAIQL